MKKIFRLATCCEHETCTAPKVLYLISEKGALCFLLMLSTVLVASFFKDHRAAVESRMGMAGYQKTNVVINHRRVRGPKWYSKFSLHPAKPKGQNVGNAVPVEPQGFEGLADVWDHYGLWSMDASCRSLNIESQQVFKPSNRAGTCPIASNHELSG